MLSSAVSGTALGGFVSEWMYCGLLLTCADKTYNLAPSVLVAAQLEVQTIQLISKLFAFLLVHAYTVTR